MALISPAGPLAGEAELTRAIASAQSLGWEVQVGEHALARRGYFAGGDADRADDLVSALENDTVDGIWCLRGGYGSARLLPRVSDALRRTAPKALIGYSDVTALHAAWQHAGLVSFHGPTARAPLTAFSRDSLVRAVQSGVDSCGVWDHARVVRHGTATGRLLGGNLALIASLCGTPWALNFRDAVVVFEDVNEPTYRLDRMLTQLRLAGAFAGCRALAFGQFTDCPDTTNDGGRSLESLATELADALRVPVVTGISVGHVPDQWTLPLGALATLDTIAGTLRVQRTRV